MTAQTSPDPAADLATAGDDQKPHDFSYGHGRMPLFMKVLWLGFLVFGAVYVVKYLLNALSQELPR